MSLSGSHGVIVGMLVMLVVLVVMLVDQRPMPVGVLMALAQVQPNPARHQDSGGREAHRR